MDRTVHVRIHGHSMWPTYEDQQIVAFRRKEERTVPAEGLVVLAQHRFKPDVKVVKRIRHVTDEGGSSSKVTSPIRWAARIHTTSGRCSPRPSSRSLNTRQD